MSTVKHVRIVYEVDTAKLTQSDEIIKQIAKDLNVTEKEVRDVTNQFNQQPGILNKITAQIKQLEAAQKKANRPQDVQKYTKEIHALETQMRKLTTVTNQAGGGASKFGGIISSLGPSIGIAFGVGALVSFGKSAINLAGQMETLRVSFDVLLGSTEKSKKLLEELEAFANTTPFEFPEIAALGKKLLAVGVPAGQVTESIKRIGELSAASGQPLERLGIIYAQVMAKGRLQGEENMQLLEAGISLNKELAIVTGLTGVALEKAMSAGKISAEDFNKALKIATSEGGRFFGLIDKQSQTFEGKMSTMADAWGKFMRTIGESVALKGFIDKLTGAIEGMRLLFIGEAARGAEHHAKVVDHLAIKYREIADEARGIANAGGLTGDEADEKALNKLTDRRDRAVVEWQKTREKIVKEIEQMKAAKGFLPWREEEAAINEATEALKQQDKSIQIHIDAIAKVKGEILSGVVARDQAKIAADELAKKELEAAAALLPLVGSLGDLELKLKDLVELQTYHTVLGSDLYIETGKQITDLENKIIRLKQTIDHSKLNEVTDMNITASGDPMEAITKGIELRKAEEAKAAEDIGAFYETVNDKTQDNILAKQEEATEKYIQDQIDAQKRIEEERAEIVRGSVDLLLQLLTLLQHQNQQEHDERMVQIKAEYDSDILQAGTNAKLKEAAEKKFAAQKKAADQQAAERAKQIAIVQAIINTAVAVVAALPNYVLAALVAATGAIQIGIIASQKTTFKEGGYTGNGKDRDHTGERVAGIVHEKEFVFNKKRTKEWFPIFQQIHTGELKKDAFVQSMTMNPNGTFEVNATLSDKNMVRKMDRTNSLLEQLVSQKQTFESNYTDKRRFLN